MTTTRRQEPELGAVVGGLADHALTVLDRPRQPRLLVQGIDPADRRRVTTRRERKDAGAHAYQR